MLGAALLAGCAMEEEPLTAAAAGANDCFRPDAVSGFTPIDDDTVDVRVGVGRSYRLQLVGTCPDVDWTQQLAIRSRTGWICSGLDAELIVPSPTGTQTCPVVDIRRLTQAEIEAARQTR